MNEYLYTRALQDYERQWSESVEDDEEEYTKEDYMDDWANDAIEDLRIEERCGC